MHHVARLALITFYFALLYLVLLNVYITIIDLKRQLDFIRNNYDGAATDFIQSHKLKHRLLASFLVLSIFYLSLVITGLGWQMSN